MANFLIVGIGCSAGGLEPLQQLVSRIPRTGGLALVVAAHLDPTQESHLTELLGRRAELEVLQVEDQSAVEPDHVYVIAPDRELSIRNGVLHSRKPTAPRGQRHPVDTFFHSLAEDQGERAVAIVLSGTGSNGSQGLRFIKAEGGVVIVQEPGTAAFEGMPRSAIATGVVDLVLAPEVMPETLLNLARHAVVRRPEAAEAATSEEQLKALLALLRSRTRQDFSGYRKRTLLRRIHRRMGLFQISELADYLERLREDADEVQALAADLTINVTGFFRDPEAWQALATNVIEPLVRARPLDATIRVWVPGCATGEEAYSVAMLIIEHAERVKKIFDLRLFATDVAQGVLSTARAGTYPASVDADVGPERLQRFFEREDDHYVIRKSLRETLTFAPQNLLQDPPFSRMDLISCRNLLIYLEPDVQKQVLALSHFALREGGHLFLGPSETVSGQEELFEPVSKKWRIYRRVGPTRNEAVDFPLTGIRHREPVGRTHEQPRGPEPRARPGTLMDQAILDRFAPASVLIDPHFRVHYLRGPTEDYLRPPRGEPSYNLLGMVREGLQGPLRLTVRRALEEGREVRGAARVRRRSGLQPVQIVALPLGTARDEHRLLVTFLDRDIDAEDPEAAPEAEPVDDGGRLQAELDTTREDLRLTIEQMEGSNEELQASNEEVRSINEELQASNEELETSKEELQSLNEELHTVNSQLRAKVLELEERTADLNNLLNSSQVATLFLDRALCIRRFTPAMKDLLELRPSDVGRPAAHFAQRFTGGDLLGDAQQVIDELLPSDVEVQGDDGRWYIRRMAPYRSADDRIEGVVVTFTDISKRKRGEQALRDSEARFRQFAEHSNDVLWILDLEADRLQYLSPAYERVWGAARAPIMADIGQWRELLHPEDRQRAPEAISRVRQGEQVVSEYRIIRPSDGEIRWIRDSGFPMPDETGWVRRAGGIARDVTERRRAEEERELLARELSHRVKNILAVVQALARQTSAESEADYQRVFVGRLQALARAHSLLLEAQWRGADLRALVENAVAAYNVDHPQVIAIEGEPVPVGSRKALGLCLVLHELGTNAAKYGALSGHEGRLRVAWEVEDGEAGRLVQLRWHERHGPPVVAPVTRGFGTRLIEQACTQELDGTLNLDYAPEGLVCELGFPLDEGG